MSWVSGDATVDKVVCSIAGAPNGSVEFNNSGIMFFCGLNCVEDYSTKFISESVVLKEVSCIILKQ